VKHVDRKPDSTGTLRIVRNLDRRGMRWVIGRPKHNEEKRPANFLFFRDSTRESAALLLFPVPKDNIRCYNMCIRHQPFSQRRQFPMRPASVTIFQDTARFCFNSVLEMTGTSVRDVIYERLERRGIPASDIFRLESMIWWQF
jgi:hypothetical protein